MNLGPFRFEIKHNSPLRALIHDFLYPDELKNLKSSTLLKLSYEKSIPLVENGQGHKAATYFIEEHENEV